LVWIFKCEDRAGLFQVKATSGAPLPAALQHDKAGQAHAA
jgi:hypothetical protein